jgi:hypothetical protein
VWRLPDVAEIGGDGSHLSVGYSRSYVIGYARTERQARQYVEADEARVEPLFVAFGSLGRIEVVGGKDDLEEVLFTLWARDVEHERNALSLDSDSCLLQYFALDASSGPLIAVRRPTGQNPDVVVGAVAKQHTLTTNDQCRTTNGDGFRDFHVTSLRGLPLLFYLAILGSRVAMGEGIPRSRFQESWHGVGDTR